MINKLYAGVLFFLFLMSYGCKKEQSSTASTNQSTGLVSFKYYGAVWTSNSRNKMILINDSLRNSVGAHVDTDTLTLMAVRTLGFDTSMLYMNVLLNGNRTGTYQMNGTDYNIYFFPGLDMRNIELYKLFFTTTSTLTITKFDPSMHQISGSFQTKHVSNLMSDSIVLTNGVFNDVYLD